MAILSPRYPAAICASVTTDAGGMACPIRTAASDARPRPRSANQSEGKAQE